MSVAPTLEKSVKPEADVNRHFRTDHLTADLGVRSARGGAVTIASQGLKFITSMAGTIILARLLTPQDYGLIGMVAIVINFVSMFQYLGLSTATVKWAELESSAGQHAFLAEHVGEHRDYVTDSGERSSLAWFFGDPRLIGITFGYSISIIFTGLNIQHEAILSRQMRFTALAIIDISSLLGGLRRAYRCLVRSRLLGFSA